MPQLKLMYFDFDGGRGEPARLALHIGGIPFEDRRIGFKEWDALRETMPFRALPVLEVDGRLVTQSNGINRYVGKLAGLYPQDDWQALLCDEAMDAVEDMDFQIGITIGLDAAAKKRAREALAAGPLPRYLAQFPAPDRRRPQSLDAGALAASGCARRHSQRPRGPARAATGRACRAARGAAADRGVLRDPQDSLSSWTPPRKAGSVL
jgi:glutathione S-transferase